MKINWGHIIFMVYISFVIIIGLLVYRSSQEHFDLVSEDYYNKEIKYQDRIDDMRHTLELNEKPQTVYNKDEKLIEIKFPLAFQASAVNGEVDLFKPDNASNDFKVSLNLNNENIHIINAKKLARGAWKVKTSWTFNKISYYQEENILIN